MSAKIIVKIFYFSLHLNAAFLVSYALTGYYDENVTYNRTPDKGNENIGPCRDDQFQCNNGECIKDQLLCDGRADCSDQSDEAWAPCASPLLMCPESAFRCDYGACIHQNMVCNGVKDCIDNSDELLDDCSRNSPQLERPIYVRIYNNEEYRQYAPQHKTLPWVIYAIRSRMTGRTLAVEPKSSRLTSSPNFTLLNASRNLRLTDTRCTVPPQPPNGHWQLHRQSCESDENCDVPQGATLKPGSRLVYSCDAEYSVSGNTDVYCEDGGSWSPIPECIANTCTPLNSISWAATCSRDGVRVSCESFILPRTKAKLRCRINYALELNFVQTVAEQDIECNQDGRWEPEPITCRPICGLADPSSQKVEMINGVLVESGGFPWHANVWKNDGSEVRSFRCSATIVQSNLVLTTAKCILNNISGSSEDPALLLVTAGSAYLNSNNSSKFSSTVYKVKNVYRNCLDSNLLSNYTSDIALIELSDRFQFSDALLPVCLDVSSRSERLFQSRFTGWVGGFGRNSVTASSPTLRLVPISYVSNDECRMLHNGSRIEVAMKNDEFCGVNSHVSELMTIYDWSLGGGLVVQKGGLWHIIGIRSMGTIDGFASYGVNTINSDNRQYSKYTNISAYVTWLQNVFFKLERYKSYPACSSYIPPRLVSNEPLAARRFGTIPRRPPPLLPPFKIDNSGNRVVGGTAIASGGGGGGDGGDLGGEPGRNRNAGYAGYAGYAGSAGYAGYAGSASHALAASRPDIYPAAGYPSLPVQEPALEPIPTMRTTSAPDKFNAQLPSNPGLRTPVPVFPIYVTPTSPSFTRRPPVPRPPAIVITEVITQNSINVETTSNKEDVSCAVPPQPANGEWKLHPSHCKGNTDCTYPADTAPEPVIRLVYSCRPGFRLDGSPDVVCDKQLVNWSSIPTCVAITCPSLDSVSRIVTCYRGNRWTPCNSSALPNTTASLSCRPAYEEDSGLSKVHSKTVTCNMNGEWEPNPITCIPVCGITYTQSTSAMIGEVADILQLPWHATLYKQKDPPEGPKDFACGATLIQNNLLLTAAKCVYDDIFGTVDLADKFYVITGNKFSGYDSPLQDPGLVQKATVKSIHVPCEYSGLNGNQENDIAIIELREPFQLSGISIPACIDVLGTEGLLLKSNWLGRYPAFGITEASTSSGISSNLNSPYVLYRACETLNALGEYAELLGDVKFCGETRKGLTVTDEYIGGGLVSQINGTRWYVTGILTRIFRMAASTGYESSNGDHAVFTKISFHKKWIQNVMFNLERYGYSPSCEPSVD